MSKTTREIYSVESLYVLAFNDHMFVCSEGDTRVEVDCMFCDFSMITDVSDVPEEYYNFVYMWFIGTSLEHGPCGA